MATTPEGRVKKNIKKWLKKYLPKAWWWMPVKTVHGVNGMPDYCCVVPLTIKPDMVGKTIGVFVGIEAKAGKGVQTPSQEDRQVDIEAAHGIYILIRGSDNIESAMIEGLSKILR
jgi:hypothetical protein